MLVVAIAGPIASGKSSLGRATAARLEELAVAEVGVVDLDLIYEMLDSRGGSGRPKSDERLWSQARRVAGRLTGALLAEGRYVVAEGNFAEDRSLAEFERELPGGARLRLVMLQVDFEIALQRTESRCLSRSLEEPGVPVGSPQRVLTSVARARGASPRHGCTVARRGHAGGCHLAHLDKVTTALGGTANYG